MMPTEGHKQLSIASLRGCWIFILQVISNFHMECNNYNNFLSAGTCSVSFHGRENLTSIVHSIFNFLVAAQHSSTGPLKWITILKNIIIVNAKRKMAMNYVLLDIWTDAIFIFVFFCVEGWNVHSTFVLRNVVHNEHIAQVNSNNITVGYSHS